MAKAVPSQLEAPESWDVLLVPSHESAGTDFRERRNRGPSTDISGLERRYTVPSNRQNSASVGPGANVADIEPAELEPGPGANLIAEEKAPLVRQIALSAAPASQFEQLKLWEGTVTEIGETEFVATLRDLGDQEDPSRIEAVFDVKEVSPGDQHLLALGAVFTWTIARETSIDGQVRNVDFMRFLRLPAWSRREVESVRRRAEEFRSRFGIDVQ